MFRRTNKQNIRKRREVEDDEEEQPPVAPTKNLPTNENVVEEVKKTNKKPKPKFQSKSLLSFGDNEEEEEIVFVKKSSRSKKIAKHIKKQNIEDEKSQEASLETKIVEEPVKEVPITLSDDDIAFKVAEMITPPDPKPTVPDVGSGVIPDASVIHAARKQREWVRKRASDFVPTVEAVQKYKQSQSRIIREDDNDMSSDEGDLEMKSLLDKMNGKKNLQGKVTVMPEDQDDEVSRWEEELIRKGGYNQIIQHDQSVQSQFRNVTSQQPIDQSATSIKSTVTFNSIKDKLQNFILNLKKKHKEDEDEMKKLILDKEQCKEMLEHLKDTKSLNDEFVFFQEIRMYVRNLSGCLREKMPQIQALEEGMMQLWRTNAAQLSQRRARDMQDESMQCGGQLPDRNTPEGEDFFARVREREARRARRVAKRQIESKRSKHHEGMSSDDEDTASNRAVYISESSKISSQQKEMFEDAAEDFASIQMILEKFRRWRDQHPGSYYDAFISLCVPALLHPFVRFQLIFWNPLRGSIENWENFSWFKTISQFALENWKDEDQDQNNLLEDAKIISSVIEKCVFNKIQALTSDVWNPLSTTQTKLLATQFKYLIDGYPFINSKNEISQNLVKNICKRIQKTINNEVYIPFLTSNKASENEKRFFERQCWSAIKLFKNILILNEILSFEAIKELAFDTLLNRYVVLSLQTSAVDVKCLEKCFTIVQSIPTSFIKHPESQSILSHLNRFLLQFSKKMKQTEDPTNMKIDDNLKILISKLSL